MTRPSPLELLRSTHQFPCRFTFKVIGRCEADFVLRAVAAVSRALPEGALPVHSSRQTASGRHIAVTIEPEVASAEQVLEIYALLRRLEGLVLLL
jgi:putative lipoic acid-binding regulatory protein